MKKILGTTILLAAAVAMNSCKNSGSDKDKSDTTKSGDTVAVKYILDDLLDIKDEAELKTKFGAEHISWDTVWGAEGEFTMGSFIDKGKADEVEIIWADDKTHSDVASVAVNSWHVEDPSKIFNGKWQSSTGIKLGMTTDELEKMNGKSFVFYGFGWDYAGTVTDWREGNLDKAGIGIQLSEGPAGEKLPESEYLQVVGDREIKSDHPVVKKIQPRVIRVTVFKNEY